MSRKTTVTYTDNDRAIVSMLSNAADGLTLAELNASRDIKFAPGSLTSAVKKGLISVIGTREIERTTQRAVSTYSFVTDEVLSGPKGAFNYTENERNVLAAAKGLNGNFTLAGLAAAMGLERLSSGNINGLVKKGNIAKGDQIKVAATSFDEVNVYGVNAQLPDAFKF